MRIAGWPRTWHDEQGSKSANLLISILVRYPELASVNFDPRERTLKFTFMVRNRVQGKEVRRFATELSMALDVLSGLESKRPSTVAIGHISYGAVTAIGLTRDVSTLTQEEIWMTIQLVKDWFADQLVRDVVADVSVDEELAIQEELIGQMLEDVKVARQDRDLIAVREEGRVLVFNK